MISKETCVKSSEKLYKVGMYGGKFMPMHKGHLWCLQKASEECETVYLIMFYGGDQEETIHKNSGEFYLSKEARDAQIKRAAAMFANVIPVIVDVSSCRLPNGEEDWDAETPLVEEVCGHLDAVYASEPGYAPYFAKAYPDAVYRMLDADRSAIHISATDIRNMKPDERTEWMV